MPFEFTNWLLVFARVSALLAVFPVFNVRNVPTQLRLALGVLLALLIAPGLPPMSLEKISLAHFIVLMVKEVGIGVLFGFVARMAFYMLDVAGAIITQEMGLGMAATLNPFSDTHSEAPGTILYYLAVIVFLALDLHHWLIVALQQSYRVLPVGFGAMSEPLFNNVVGQTSKMFLVALLMAAPLISVSFVLSLVFSVLGRAVPQMNVFTESFSLRTLAGLMVFGLSLNLMALHISNWLKHLPQDVLRVAELLRG
jgi:flagellar biosynthetic protein FliR